MVRNLSANAGDAKDLSLIPESGSSPGVATHSSISCLENSVDRGARRATVHEVAEKWT